MNFINHSSLVGFGLLLAHAWILFGHFHKMGTEEGDQRKDPIARPAQIRLGLGGVLAVQALGYYRMVLLSVGHWSEQGLVNRVIGLFGLEPSALLLWSGVALFLCGWGLRYWATRTLGRLFTYEIGIRNGHQVVDKGPYHWIRHPAYTGYLLIGAGISLSYYTLFGLILVALFVGGFFVLRITEEEKMLDAHFGNAYRQYQRRTKRLIPFLY